MILIKIYLKLQTLVQIYVKITLVMLVILCFSLTVNKLKYTYVHRPKIIGKLIDWSVNRNLIVKYFDSWLILRVISQAKIPDISCVQLLSCEDLMVFSSLYDCEVNLFASWTAGQTKQDIRIFYVGVWVIATNICSLFYLHLTGLMIK